MDLSQRCQSLSFAGAVQPYQGLYQPILIGQQPNSSPNRSLAPSIVSSGYLGTKPGQEDKETRSYPQKLKVLPYPQERIKNRKGKADKLWSKRISPSPSPSFSLSSSSILCPSYTSVSPKITSPAFLCIVKNCSLVLIPRFSSSCQPQPILYMPYPSIPVESYFEEAQNPAFFPPPPSLPQPSHNVFRNSYKKRES